MKTLKNWFDEAVNPGYLARAVRQAGVLVASGAFMALAAGFKLLSIALFACGLTMVLVGSLRKFSDNKERVVGHSGGKGN